MDPNSKIHRVKRVQSKLGYRLRDAVDFVNAGRDLDNDLLDSIPDLPEPKVMESAPPSAYPVLEDLRLRSVAAAERLVVTHDAAIDTGARDLEDVKDEAIAAVLGPDRGDVIFAAMTDDDLPAEGSLEEEIDEDQGETMSDAFVELVLLARRCERLTEEERFGILSPEMTAVRTLNLMGKEMEEREADLGLPEDRPWEAASSDLLSFLHQAVWGWVYNVRDGVGIVCNPTMRRMLDEEDDAA